MDEGPLLVDPPCPYCGNDRVTIERGDRTIKARCTRCKLVVFHEETDARPDTRSDREAR